MRGKDLAVDLGGSGEIGLAQMDIAEAQPGGDVVGREFDGALPEGEGGGVVAVAGEDGGVEVEPAGFAGLEAREPGVALGGLGEEAVGVVETAELGQ
ncbi:MAG TPA: hypothetical protein PK322_09235, partial [Opitutaceae bacterium]|nr:hypothetical protein [Opitutaceae bacterium]